MVERPHREMQQKTRLHDSFFGLKGPEPRPSSIATEIVDTDWDEEDIVSEIEDDDPNSPRVSLNSSGLQSVTTLSSYEEAQTPRSSRARTAFPFDFELSKPVEGPRGPHLFRMSSTSTQSFELQEALSLSPITPRAPKPIETEFRFHLAEEPLPARSRSSPYQFTDVNLDQYDLPEWSPEMVAQWMLNAGIEPTVAEKFIENDINGQILMTLKSEDMKELNIQSFGIRTAVWNHICELIKMKPVSPRPETPIEDEECKEVRRERKKLDRCEEDVRPRRGQSKRRLNKPCHEDIISPLESVSIVGIEQVMPKPHKCSKGENCRTYRRQQRMIEQFMKEHPFADTSGGVILVAGDPGNASTAPALNRPSSTEALRPMSDAVPSVVASSDVLGPGAGIGPFQYLQEATLRNVQHRDPQDNVRQFLEFQQGASNTSEVPPTPPFEVYPQNQASSERLRNLPKLAIPGRQQSPSQRTSQQQRPSNLRQSFVPYTMDKAEALSPDLQTPVAPYRFGTPFSDMDVPVTAVPLGPVARDASQSVPPDMGYRAGPAAVPVRSLSRASRRPSFQVMAPLQENATTPIARVAPSTPSPTRSAPQKTPPKAPSRSQQPLQAPPRAQYPWSANQHADRFGSLDGTVKDAEGIAYQGPVRKRKTKMLRHEWHDNYATLKGTRLAIHKDAETRERTLEYVDIDDYAIACSSLASSKLNAAFKAMSISRGSKEKDDPVAAFSFQLIPQGKDGLSTRLKKRESSLGSAPLSANLEGANGTGKTHHFAVKSRDERIDWMRELMLAKALKQKGEGFEVSVNGNMI
ncbi:putative SAM and PH domain-containing protein [Seiridium cardinale]|uniref:SAM and PH domain-containing protein n=1 Tax=Seiridium cardinale TaxID=138064 RepID=A0ABR2X7P8_9PEZI